MASAALLWRLLRELIADTDVILEKTPTFRRTASGTGGRTSVRADDLIKQSYMNSHALRSMGGSTTARELGSEHCRQRMRRSAQGKVEKTLASSPAPAV
jgi:hypothetical protein